MNILNNFISRQKSIVLCSTTCLLLLLTSVTWAAKKSTNVDTTKRLRIQSDCTSPLWVFHTVGTGGGTLDAPAKVELKNKGDYYDYKIPDKGLASTRFWPGAECDTKGNNCKIGSSGGPGLSCPDIGCAPPVDSKFEGTFGCLSSINKSDCQTNPSAPNTVLSREDNWDTSMVDGFTLPYKVTVAGSCPTGPIKSTIDCTDLKWSECPTNESINNSTVDLQLKDLGTGTEVVGCYSPCSKLTMNNWNNNPTYSPDSTEAAYYCCGGITPAECQAGVGAKTKYVDNIHKYCPQTYAYAYDDGTGLFTCPAAESTVYTVTFSCPQ